VKHSGYFVTGTDTGVGKTYVATALARRARELRPDARVFAFKPVETGCLTELGEDQRDLVEAAGAWQQGPLRGLYQFRQPAAPLVAAESEGATIDVGRVLETLHTGRASGDPWLTIVEGAGGWRVPMTSTMDMAGLAKAIGFAVIVVGRAVLGTINHSLLTLEAVERDGCRVAALVLSMRRREDRAFADSNVVQIGRRWSGKILVLEEDASVLDELLVE
jgi:dethiobiotin synthetase